MTVQDETRQIAGRTIIGQEPERAGNAGRYEQKPIEEFFPLVDAVLDTPGVHSIRWTQDIPSFNDGDPCVFSTNTFTVRLLNEGETAPTRARLEDDPDDNWEEPDAPGFVEPDYTDGYRDSYDQVVRAHAVNEAFKALDEQERHFEVVLQAAFGDYAEVTAFKDAETGEYGFHVGNHEAAY